jgi:glucose-6-phosphate isomerase
MYRRVCLSKDIDAFEKNHLRYDITVLEEGRIGDEFVKTVGHYHPFKAGTQTRYPEIYEVIHGHALFVMQKIGNSVNSVDAVYLVLAEVGEKAVMLPGTGHITVNLGNTPLVMANFVSDDFNSVYEPYRERRGAAYYILSRDGGIYILQNGAYDPIPEPRVLKPREIFLGLSLGVPLYVAASEDLERLRWLNFPEECEEELTVESLFYNAQLGLQ